MASSDAIAAFGVTLTRDEKPIAEITNIDGVELKRGTFEVSSHETDSWKEFKPEGLAEASDVSIEGNFIAGDADGQLGLQDDLDKKTLQAFVLTFPEEISASWAFNAYVTAFKVGGFPVEGKLSFSATLKISGEPVLTVGES
jgi:hypothetical protein